MFQTSDPFPPVRVVGLIGGGQLARMLAIAAAELGFRTVVFCPDVNCPAAQTSNDHIVAPYENWDAMNRLLSLCDVMTYEFENLPLPMIQSIEQKGRLYPSSHALAIAQDRLLEKHFLNEQGIRTTSWYAVHDRSSLISGLEALGGCGLLKTRRFGYDGKNQMRLHNPSEESIDQTLETLQYAPSILEEIVPFTSEISVISARDIQGTCCVYDCPENEHRAGILYKTVVPSTAPQAIQEEAQHIALRIMQTLDYVGILCVEFFVLKNGDLLVNELAPRVHNSGHWTQKACITSQFEQHIRAICGLPLGSTYRHSACTMTNLLGDNLGDLPYFLTQERTSIHLYGKDSPHPKRKMGHVIQLTGSSPDL